MGSIFAGRVTQPIHISDRDIRLSKRNDDAGLIESIENGHAEVRGRARGLADIVDERVKLEIETVRSELLEMDERLRRRHDAGMIARNFEQDCHDFAWIAAIRHAHRDRYATNTVAQRPVFYLFGDEIRIRNENVSSIERLYLGRAHADLAHVAFLAADHHEVADRDGPLRQEDQTRDEIADQTLETETDA